MGLQIDKINQKSCSLCRMNGVNVCLTRAKVDSSGSVGRGDSQHICFLAAHEKHSACSQMFLLGITNRRHKGTILGGALVGTIVLLQGNSQACSTEFDGQVCGIVFFHSLCATN